MKIESIQRGMFFRVRKDERKIAYGAMELWPTQLTCKTETGCMDLPYDEWEYVPDISGYKFYPAPYFENNLNS